jgi:hypothetical protein
VVRYNKDTNGIPDIKSGDIFLLTENLFYPHNAQSLGGPQNRGKKTKYTKVTLRKKSACLKRAPVDKAVR